METQTISIGTRQPMSKRVLGSSHYFAFGSNTIVKATLYLQILQIVSILCNLVIILVGMIHGFSDMIKLIMLGSNVAAGLLIIECEYIYIGRY